MNTSQFNHTEQNVEVKVNIPILLVRARGPLLRSIEWTQDGIAYESERDTPPAVYMTIRRPNWRWGVMPPRQTPGIKITMAALPFGKKVGVEFCGPKVDEYLTVLSGSDNYADLLDATAPLIQMVRSQFQLTKP